MSFSTGGRMVVALALAAAALGAWSGSAVAATYTCEAEGWVYAEDAYVTTSSSFRVSGNAACESESTSAEPIAGEFVLYNMNPYNSETQGYPCFGSPPLVPVVYKGYAYLSWRTLAGGYQSRSWDAKIVFPENQLVLPGELTLSGGWTVANKFKFGAGPCVGPTGGSVWGGPATTTFRADI